MKKPLLSLAAFLLLFLPAFAQKDFRPGYVVTLQNDTLRGLINYKGDTKSALECSFKTTETAETQTFKPDQIKGYGFPAEKSYESLRAKIINRKFNDITNKFEEIPVASQPEVNFMHLLVKGYASLFYLVDLSGARHFYLQKASGELKELYFLQTSVLDPKTGTKKLQRTNVYANLLANEFSDCPEITSRIPKTNLKESELVNLFVAYNQCKSPGQPVFSRTKKEPVVTFGILAGLSYSSFQPEASGHFLEKGEYKTKAAPIAGIMLDFTIPALNEKLSINNALFYTSRQYNAEIKEVLASNAYNTYKVNYSFDYLRLETALRYTAPIPTYAPFIQAGLANSLMLQGKEEIFKTRHLTDFPPEHYENTPLLTDIFRKHQLGFIAGAGIKYGLASAKALQLQLNYEMNTGFTKGVGYNTRTNNFALLAGFTF